MSLQDDFSEYAADASVPAAEAENILAQITRVARELREAQESVSAASQDLKVQQDRVRVLEEITLPGLMDEAAQKSLTTADGYVLTRDEVLRAAISEANMEKACAWLTANGQEAIIKRGISVEFGKGEAQRAAEALDALLEHNFTPRDKKSVHPMTLGSTVRELMGAGVEVPMDLLGVYVKPVVKMKVAKK